MIMHLPFSAEMAACLAQPTLNPSSVTKDRFEAEMTVSPTVTQP